jgi:hypothetical protein
MTGDVNASRRRQSDSMTAGSQFIAATEWEKPRDLNISTKEVFDVRFCKFVCFKKWGSFVTQATAVRPRSLSRSLFLLDFSLETFTK